MPGDREHDRLVTSALDFFGDSDSISATEQSRGATPSTPKNGSRLGKRAREEGGSDSESEGEESGKEAEVDCEEITCEEEGNEGSVRNKRGMKKKKLSKETKELLRRQQVRPPCKPWLVYQNYMPCLSGRPGQCIS